LGIKAFVFDAYGTLYDIQSLSAVTNKAFPGHGEYITQVWRMKQMEYSWLRTSMGRYEDFWTVTREALAYTLKTLGLAATPTLFDQIAEKYNNLEPYPDAIPALEDLRAYKLAILSQGTPAMLAALTKNSGLDKYFVANISVDSKKVFKPHPQAYATACEELGLSPADIMFVSSNGFDVCGAKSFGYRVARIERTTPGMLRESLSEGATISPKTMFHAMRSQLEEIGYGPDFNISSLRDLAKLT
jgi:2-haloacid dehalogenase